MTKSVFILWGLKIRFEEHGLPVLAQGIAMNRAEYTSLHHSWKSFIDTCVRQIPTPLVPCIINLETGYDLAPIQSLKVNFLSVESCSVGGSLEWVVPLLTCCALLALREGRKRYW